MLKRFRKKKKFSIYLGSLAVAPRSDFKRYLDEWAAFGHEDLDSALRKQLMEIFELPLASSLDQPKETDLGLDIVIPKFQSGDMWDISLGDLGFPLAWRPKVEVAARIYRLDTGKTLHTASVTAKLSWRQYFSKLFTWRTFLRFKPMFDSSDLNVLLQRACLGLLEKLRKVA
ncbi:hypothetical protein ACL7TT_16280 [Microbulbifer sp. 2304DJ12-6]|uniref:hypothetical protein n=1 Tax=Microbulbifer sp. 2304DJ12-6 TaxID=3233340 RepID=UPI0039AF9315